MKNTIPFLLIILIFQSCHYFKKNVPLKEDLVKQELKKINWNEVDEFPNTSFCDSITNKDARKQCFFDYVSQTMHQKLAPDSIRKSYPRIDTLNVKITIFSDSKLAFESLDTIEKTKIDSLMQLHFANFPTIEPAIKRGIKVKTQFILPVVLNK